MRRIASWRKAIRFVIARSEATWQSHAAGYVFAGTYLLFGLSYEFAASGFFFSEYLNFTRQQPL